MLRTIVLSSWVFASGTLLAQQPPLGAAPAAESVPRLEFVFEERVTIAAPVVLGDTMLGHRQFIPITGGTVAGPKLNGQVLPGGWDFQLTYAANRCTQFSADYFLKAEDGTVIRVFNEGLFCPGTRGIFRPKLEAPAGKHAWLTQAAFVATLEIETPKAQPGMPVPPVDAVRIRFYQVL